MLQAIRDRVTGVVAIFILGFLAIPFVFFGMESYTRSVPQDAVASVGGQDISSSEFQTSFAEYRTRMRQQQGDAYDEAAMNQLSVRRQHLDDMIDEMLLVQFAQDAGLTVSSGEVARLIHSVPAFQVGGQFDPETYRRQLQTRGRTPRGFEAEIREDMLSRKVPGALADSSIVTPFERNLMLGIQQETRDIRYVEIPGSDFADEIEVTEEDVAAYYDENQSEFLTTERVSLEYVELDSEALVPDMMVEEDELLRRYEAARSRYISPERRQAAHILLESNDERDAAEAEALAEELVGRIRDGEDFAELAREYSDDSGSRREGGDLGWIEPDVMVRAFEEALYSMESPGDVSDPVETGFGWHIIQLQDIQEPEGMSFEEARPEILEAYREEQADRLFREVSDRLIDLVYGDPTSLEPIADELDLDIRTTELFSREGGEGIAANREVIEAAFSDLVLLDGHTSDPIELDRNRMVAVRLAAHEPAEPRPLESVAESIRQRIADERALARAEEEARNLARRLQEEDLDLNELADEIGQEVQAEEAVTRQSFQLGPAFLQDLFRLPAPDETPTLHVLPRNGGWALVELNQVTPGDAMVVQDAQRNAIEQQLRFGFAGYEVMGLIEHMRENTDIRIVEDRL